MTDIILINPGDRIQTYQSLGKDIAAIEPPTYLLLMATYLRQKGYAVKLYDIPASTQTEEEIADEIVKINPTLVGVFVYGAQPSASTQHMLAARKICQLIKDKNKDQKIMMSGTHPSALPERTLREEPVDFVCSRDGFGTTESLLFELKHYSDFEMVPSLWYWKLGLPQFTVDGPLLKNADLDAQMPIPAWDLIDFNNYRAHNWHALSNDGIRTPYASMYTTLGCPFQCFDKNTPITTGYGNPSKKAKDIKVGDKLLAFNEKSGKVEETEVKQIFSREVEELLKITFDDGRILKVTEEHPFYVKKEWIKAKDLKINDEIYSISRLDKLALSPFRSGKGRKMLKEEKINRSKSMQNYFSKNYKGSSHESANKNTFIKLNKSDKHRKRMSDFMKNNNPAKIKSIQEKISKTLIKGIEEGRIKPYFRTDEYWKKLRTEKNKQEIKLENLLNKNFPNSFKFSGDGSTKISHFAPDFINETHKKIIEFNGCYWHKCEKCFPKLHTEALERRKKDKRGCSSREEMRIKIFEKNGYKTLEIWEHELNNNEQSIISKIGHFLYNGKKITKIEKIKGDFEVINFSCSPHENYFANMLLSHNCSFCCINSPFSDLDKPNSYRMWSPENIIKQLEYLVSKGVRNIKIVDEMFVLNKKHVIGICDAIIERGLGDKLNIWAYARVDTVKDEFLEKLSKAGFRWLALGIESASKHVRDGANKLYTNDDIKEIVKKIQSYDINVIGNYIFGLPDDTMESMQNTLDLAKELNCEFANFYSAMAYPGSQLYKDALDKGWDLPENWNGYSQHAYESFPLRTDALTNDQVLGFRDKAYLDYFTNERYLDMVEKKFGIKQRQDIEEINKIKLKRRILETK